MTKKILLIAAIIMLGFSCKQNPATPQAVESVTVPAFNPDSAYQYTANQVAFGPRVPNTEAHKQCGDYLANELRRFGATVVEQEAVLYTYDNQALKARNIIGSFSPENKNRILLCAHWDTRPFADHDPDPANHRTAIDGANDGAGACGALLEIARQIGIEQPKLGVDIIFFDAEDWGAPEFEAHAEGGWCLGSEHWARNPHVLNYTARFGILLDMVSAKGAQFYKEQFSMHYAKNVVNKVWEAALIEGYGSFFVNELGGAIQDDHVPVNQIRKIPCIDIIHHDPTTATGFGSYWHTLNDNMDTISKETLKAVGQTVLYVVYNEK